MRMIDEVIDKFVDYYSAIEMRSPMILEDIYHPDVVLIDPFGNHNGLFELKKSLAPLIFNINVHYILTDEPLSDENSFFVTWTLYWSHPVLTCNQITELQGCTYARAENKKINLQKNYYDLGACLYEKTPFLKCAIKQIKCFQVNKDPNDKSYPP